MNNKVKDEFNNVYFILFLFAIIIVFVWIFTVGHLYEDITALEMLHDKEYCLECNTIVEKK